jgi:hypothetical protein
MIVPGSSILEENRYHNMISDLTPIRIRGKRSGAATEKWHTRKRRRLTHRRPSATTALLSTKSDDLARDAKRRRLDLSALELLPTELIQAIFVQSGNLDLPVTSWNLTAQLSGKRLQWELMCDALSPVVFQREPDSANLAELARASRMLNSRFLTWQVLRQWLDHECVARGLDIEEAQPSSEHLWQSRYADIWIALQPSPRFQLPSKAVQGPWTSDRVSFLKVFSLYRDGCSTPLDGIVAEVAREGFAQAVEEQSLDVIKLLRNLGVKPDQKLLRQAVLDYGCDKETVLYLLQWCLVELMRWNVVPSNADPRPQVDFLDPMLWAWTDKAKAVGEQKGEWLTSVLRRLSSLATSEDAEELSRLEQDDSLYMLQWQ